MRFFSPVSLRIEERELPPGQHLLVSATVVREVEGGGFVPVDGAAEYFVVAADLAKLAKLKVRPAVEFVPDPQEMPLDGREAVRLSEEQQRREEIERNMAELRERGLVTSPPEE